MFTGPCLYGQAVGLTVFTITSRIKSGARVRVADGNLEGQTIPEHCFIATIKIDFQMSLHLGNLSSRVRRDELERVFRRFGRCSVQVKDKFGFVVYDYPVNAERALKTLRGKKICGELLTLSWSNRQPRPLPRARGGKSYDSRHGRNTRKENYVNRKLSSDGRQDSRMSYKQPDAAGRIFSPADEPEDATNCDTDNAKFYGMKEELADADGGPNENILENDRWEEQIDDLPNGNELENVSEFDRYEPYSGEDKRDDDEINHDVQQGGSPTAEDSQQRKGVVQIGKANFDQVVTAKTQQGCYNCGELGHKMRNCPQEKASKKKLNRFDHRRNDKSNYTSKGEDELTRIESDSRGRGRSSRDAVTIRSHKGSREASSYRKHHPSTRTDYSPVDNGINGSHGKEYEGMKRTRETESPERHRAWKSRRPHSSPIHSVGKASRSKSRSKYSKSTIGFAPNSNFRSRSLSSSSTFSSKSHSHRPRNHRSRSRSGSRSCSSSRASLYVSTSSRRSSTPSPTKLQIGEKDSFTKATSPEQKEVQIRSAQLVEGDTGFENPKLDTMTTVEDGNEVVHSQEDEGMDVCHIQKCEEDTHLDEGTYLSDPLLEDGGLTGEIRSPTSTRGTRDLQICDVNISEHPVAPMLNHESEVDSSSHKTTKSMRMTSEEMLMVIKHYGWKQPEGVDKNLPVGSYFGSARLWPWEVIYYRRLKKGPISTENYARRISQNKEFGIVDKYVRSSSGWGEVGEDGS